MPDLLPSLNIRRATADDSRDIWVWRNDPTTRAMSKTQDEVAWEDHAAWFTRTLADQKVRIFIGDLGGDSVGMCRFDRRSDPAACEVSINLNPDFRGKGHASRLLALAITACEDTFSDPPVGHMIAEIRHDNAPSIHCFSRNGFVLESRTPELGRYRLTRQARPVIQAAAET